MHVSNDHVFECIRVGINTALEELGLEGEQARARVSQVMQNNGFDLKRAALVGLTDYLSKLDFNGGKPKPPQVIEG